MKIENAIASAVIGAVKELYGQDVPEKMVALHPNPEGYRLMGEYAAEKVK